MNEAGHVGKKLWSTRGDAERRPYEVLCRLGCC